MGHKKCGISVTDQKLAEVAQLSGVEDMENDFLEEDFRQEYERHIAETDGGRGMYPPCPPPPRPIRL